MLPFVSGGSVGNGYGTTRKVFRRVILFGTNPSDSFLIRVVVSAFGFYLYRTDYDIRYNCSELLVYTFVVYNIYFVGLQWLFLALFFGAFAPSFV
jgi:hypothetical protein